jgi:ABC-type transport system involved in multi-copper enzyme maturation permease subunit
MIHGNPIFQREVSAAVRDPRILFFIIGFLAILSAILMLLWPSSGLFSVADAGSMQIFTIFLMSNLTLIILLVPALTSSAITSERENKSYDLLFTSLLTPGEILRGKLFASLALIFLVVLVSMPIAALCSLSGGVGPLLLCRAYAVIAMSAFTYGLVGLAVSACCQRTMTSLLVAYGIVILLAGCTWLPSALLGENFQFRTLWAVIRCLSPYDAMYALILPQNYEAAQESKVFSHHLTPFYVHIGGMITIFCAFLLMFSRSVLAAPKPEIICRRLAIALSVLMVPIVGVELLGLLGSMANPQAKQLYGDMATTKFIVLFVALDGALLLMIRALFRRANRTVEEVEEEKEAQIADRPHKPISRWKNAIYYAERHSKVYGQSRFIWLGLVICLSLSIILLLLTLRDYATRLGQDTVRWVAIVFQTGVVALLAPAVSSGAITAERQGGTLVMLRMAPLSAIYVVFGKLKASLLYVSLFLIASLPVLFSLAYIEVQTNYWRVGAWFAVLCVTAFTLTTAGLCASAYCKRTSVATGISYGISAIICVATFVALLPNTFSEGIQRFLLTLNPMVAALRVTSDNLFAELPADVWKHNLMLLGSLSAIFVIAASWRIYCTFSRQS